jgi:hypothetical protein
MTAPVRTCPVKYQAAVHQAPAGLFPGPHEPATGPLRGPASAPGERRCEAGLPGEGPAPEPHTPSSAPMTRGTSRATAAPADRRHGGPAKKHTPLLLDESFEPPPHPVSTREKATVDTKPTTAKNRHRTTGQTEHLDLPAPIEARPTDLAPVRTPARLPATHSRQPGTGAADGNGAAAETGRPPAPPAPHPARRHGRGERRATTARKAGNETAGRKREKNDAAGAAWQAQTGTTAEERRGGRKRPAERTGGPGRRTRSTTTGGRRQTGDWAERRQAPRSRAQGRHRTAGAAPRRRGQAGAEHVQPPPAKNVRPPQ